jgi:TetR/AcrR family transcriptional repressor of nem operon
MVTNTALEVAPHDEEVRRIVAGVQTRVEEFFVEQIERSKADGATPVDIDAHAEAGVLLATLIGIAVLARTRPNKKFLMSIADEAVGRLQRRDV